jgi:hypothetical protein
MVARPVPCFAQTATPTVNELLDHCIAILEGAAHRADEARRLIDTNMASCSARLVMTARIVAAERLREAALFAVAVHNDGILALRTAGDVDALIKGKNDPGLTKGQQQEYDRLLRQAVANAHRDDDLTKRYMDGYINTIIDLAAVEPGALQEAETSDRSEFERRGWRDLVNRLAQVIGHVEDARRAAGIVDDDMRKRWLSELAPALDQGHEIMRRHPELTGG